MKIALIAPYQEMAELSREICHDLNLDVSIYTGNMEDGLQAARDAKERGVNLLISRGLTAELIREHIQLPVVEIGISAFDLYKSILPFIETDHVIGIIGHKDVIKKAEIIRSTLNVDIPFIALTTQENILEIVQKAKSQGVTLIAEAMASHKTVETSNITSILIKSDEDSITNALQYATAINSHLIHKNELNRRLYSLLDAMDGGALISSSKGEVLHANTQAQRFLGEKLDRNLTLETLFPGVQWNELLTGKTVEINTMVQTGATLFSIKAKHHIYNGDMSHITCTFNEARQIEKIENSFRREQVKKHPGAKHSFHSIIHQSETMCMAIAKAKRYSQTDSSVLLVGETGTGKELFAQSIHNHSSRRNNNFIAINCGAMAEDILESELFGYEEGAFTGALKGGRPGVFELAHKGTLFLDEINATSNKMQTRLLRTLQEGEIRRVGSTKMLPIDVRIIAATNTQLEEEVDAGKFRQDLFFRLNVLDVNIPSLSDRKEDILPLFTNFLQEHCFKQKIDIRPLSTDKKNELQAYHWPGNVRELQNHAEKYAILYPEKIPLGRSRTVGTVQAELPTGTLEEITTSIIQRVLKEEDGNVSRTARRLNINRNTVKKRL